MATKFRIVKGAYHKDMPLVRLEFDKIIRPLYGCQLKALKQIELSTDRRCELLLDENDVPCGVLVYKTGFQNEYRQFGVINSVEIKTLFVINSFSNRGKGYGQILLDKVFNYAKSIGAQGIHVTVGDKVPQSIRFFKKNNFKILHSWKGRYLPGVDEHLLYWESQ